MSEGASVLFGHSRPLIEFDPRRWPELPFRLCSALALLCLGVALLAALQPQPLLRWLPFTQDSGANTLLALAALAAAVALRQRGRALLADALLTAAALLAVLPLLQHLTGAVPGDGPWRLLIDTRHQPGLSNYWPGRMSAFASLLLLLAAACVHALARLTGRRAVRHWMFLYAALFVLVLIGFVGELVGVPVLVAPWGQGDAVGVLCSGALLGLVFALFRVAVADRAVGEYFVGRPDRSVFAVSVFGLLAMLVVGGVTIGGVMAPVGLSGYRAALADALRTHILLAESEIGRLQGVADEALRRVRDGALDWYVVDDYGAAAARPVVRLESPAQALPLPEGVLALELEGARGLTLMRRGGWRLEARRAVGDGRTVVVELPFQPFDLLTERAAALGRSGELVVCGRGGGGGPEYCFPTRQIGQSFPRMVAQERKLQRTPMGRALNGESGIAEVRDYRQREVVAAFAPLGGSGAGAVLKVDLVELQAPLRNALWVAMAGVLLLALAGGVVVNRHVRPLIQQLAHTERALNRAQAVARVGSWHSAAASGRIIWSPETYRIFGLPQGEPMSHERFMSCVHPDDRELVAAAWRASLDGAPYDVEHRILVDGRERWVHERAELEFDGSGAVCGATGTVEDVTERKARAAELLGSRQKLRELAAHHEKLREEERTHIAREIHDELGQCLTALRTDAAMLQLHFGEGNPQLAQKVSAMKRLIDRTIKVVRSVATTLRPAALDLGLESAAEWLVGEFRERHCIDVELRLPAQELALDDVRATVVFRILQESLTNIARHAEASRVEVNIAVDEEDSVVLEVRDNGRGFDPTTVRERKTFGLMGMRERALALGGEARFSSMPGEGMVLRVRIPLAPAEGEA